MGASILIAGVIHDHRGLTPEQRVMLALAMGEALAGACPGFDRSRFFLAATGPR